MLGERAFGRDHPTPMNSMLGLRARTLAGATGWLWTLMA